MKEVTVKLYQFNELSDKAKENAREWFRTLLGWEPDWTESTWDDAKQILAYLGFENMEFEYSGFFSQGDGASITGQWSKRLDGISADVGRLQNVKQHAPNDEELHRIAKEFDEIAACVSDQFKCEITHDRGHYYHDGTMRFEFSDELGEVRIEELEAVCDKFSEAARSFARWLYKQLEKEHEYRNSDEAVEENIEANEYDFFESGNRPNF